jgi:hypothetical protein
VITIHEPLYLAGQQQTESAFAPLALPDNSHAAWREFRILIDFYRRGDHRGEGKTGIFSPKFGMKTKVTGQDFIDFAKANGDADVCIINAFPTLPYYSYNVWMQGEVAHPGLTEIAQNLLTAAGIKWDLSKTPRHTHGNLCYCNFWVGSELFWDRYFGEVLDPIARYLESNPDSDVSKDVMIGTRHSSPAPFLPFIIERLFSTFLSFSPDLKVASYPLGADQAMEFCNNDFEVEIVSHTKPLVDAADANDEMSGELRSLLGLLCTLGQKYGVALYQSTPHPHTGETIPV